VSNELLGRRCGCSHVVCYVLGPHRDPAIDIDPEEQLEVIPLSGIPQLQAIEERAQGLGPGQIVHCFADPGSPMRGYHQDFPIRAQTRELANHDIIVQMCPRVRCYR